MSRPNNQPEYVLKFTWVVSNTIHHTLLGNLQLSFKKGDFYAIVSVSSLKEMQVVGVCSVVLKTINDC